MNQTSGDTVRTWNDFKSRWAGVHNFLMSGECIPFEFPMPPIDRIVDELRHDELGRIGPGTIGDRLNLDDHREVFLKMPIEQALESPFSLAHFKLSRFDVSGGLLQGFESRVLDPWRAALRRHGFTFDRCYPIIFISGRGCATNYHMDFSHVLAWQIYGRKRFCGLRDPGRWAPRDMRVNYKAAAFSRPPALTDADAICFDMHPGDVLWNALLTPHWVEASDQVAMSVNLSHGGLRLNGELCPHERELEEHRRVNPDIAPAAVRAAY